jgi:hypothetical protein
MASDLHYCLTSLHSCLASTHGGLSVNSLFSWRDHECKVSSSHSNTLTKESSPLFWWTSTVENAKLAWRTSNCRMSSVNVSKTEWLNNRLFGLVVGYAWIVQATWLPLPHWTNCAERHVLLWSCRVWCFTQALTPNRDASGLAQVITLSRLFVSSTAKAKTAKLSE